MKYYEITTKKIDIVNRNGTSRIYKPAEFVCVVENEKVAKQICKHWNFEYHEIEVEEDE